MYNKHPWDTILVREQHPQLRTRFVLENGFSTSPLLACTFFLVPALAFSLFPRLWHFCLSSRCCCSRRARDRRGARRSMAQAVAVTGICLSWPLYVFTCEVPWSSANVKHVLERNTYLQPESYFSFFWLWLGAIHVCLFFVLLLR